MLYRYLLSSMFFTIALFTNSDCSEFMASFKHEMMLKPVFDGIKRGNNAYIVNDDPSYENFVQLSDVTVVAVEQFAERFDICYTAAITGALGIVGKAPQLLPVARGFDLITECAVIDKYYMQTKHPQINDLVVYTDDDLVMHHFGLVASASEIDDNIRVRSKFGTKSHIVEHRLFDGTDHDQKNAFFYTLKEPFNSDKNAMLKGLQNDIRLSQRIKDNIFYTRTLLLQLANGKNVSHRDQKYFNAQDSLSDKIWYLLKTCMGLKIDTINKLGKTPLMIAALRGDQSVIGQLLAMNADVNKQDNQNNTALHFAMKCPNESVVKYLLLQYGARQDICNNNNEKPVISEQALKLMTIWKKYLFTWASGKKIEGIEGVADVPAAQQMKSVLDKRGKNLDLNVKIEGCTLLTFAVLKENIDVVKLLIDRGVDYNVKNDDGSSAKHYGMQSENEELKKLFM